MPVQRGLREVGAADLMVIEAPALDRLELDVEPRAQTVKSYVLTRAAEQSWAKINGQFSEPSGAVFWIAGDPGCGKTHFLNYVTALDRRSGAPGGLNVRRIFCAFEVAGHAGTPDLHAYVLDVLGEQLGTQPSTLAMWRELGGVAALKLVIDEARRVGIRAIDVAIDMSASDVEAGSAFFASLAELAQSSRQLKLRALAAGQGMSPPGSIRLEVAPADDRELITVAIRRSRRIAEGADDTIADFYSGIDSESFAPEAIFPFHPSTLPVLLALMPGPVAATSRLVREAISAARDDGVLARGRLIYPSDLGDSLVIARRLDARLDESGRTALQIARAAAQQFRGSERQLTNEFVATLVFQYLTLGKMPLTLTELDARIPALAAAGADGWTTPLATELLRKLSASSGGVIRFDGNAARFDPSGSAAPELAEFNSALALVKRFDPAIGPARDASDLRAKIARLADEMSNAVESASRTHSVLAAAAAEARLELPPEHQHGIDDFVTLAQSGPAALLELAVDPVRRAEAVAVISRYEVLAGAAAVAPRLRAMNDYLEGTGLRLSLEDNPARDARVGALETECQLLRAELTPRVLASAPHNLEALEARFHMFRWTYVQLYRSSHAQWKAEMERLAPVAGDAQRRVDALRRLNVITALGPPEGDDLARQVAELGERIVRCDFDGPIQPELTPRCPHCGFAIGSVSPQKELEDVTERLARALEAKLAALSRSAIARIIREHDRDHRLDGFVKITQAARTDALVRVLDEKLARYLAQLLDENLAAAGESKGVVKKIEHRRLRTAPRRE